MRLPDITLVSGLFRTRTRHLGHQIGRKGSDVDSLKGSVEIAQFHSSSDSQGAQQDHA